MGGPRVRSDGKLTGAVGVMKIFSQMIFYSFAVCGPEAVAFRKPLTC